MQQQTFAGVGDTPLDIEGTIPEADAYLVHPILYDRINAFNPGFFERLDGLNIVGRGRPWRSETDIYYVLKGDVERYSLIMSDADLADLFPREFGKLVEEEGKLLKLAEVQGGDTVTLIDRNAMKVLEAAAGIAQALKGSIFNKNVRFGGDAGILRFDEGRAGISNLRGGCLRTAARLEAVGVPGKILVTDRFASHAQLSVQPGKLKQMEPADLPNCRTSDNLFNLAKNDAEEQILHHLFEFTP